MILKQLQWSPDEPGTHIGTGADDDSYFDVPTYSTHRSRRYTGGVSAFFTPRGVSMHDGTYLGSFRTLALAKAACQKHWDQEWRSCCR